MPSPCSTPPTSSFLPTTMAECKARGWDEVDVVFVSGDACIDHPSVAAALLGRVLEAEGCRVAILPQPPWTTPDAFRQSGRPRLCFAVGTDTWCRARLAGRAERSKAPADRPVERRYAKWAPFQGPALWLDLTADWHGEAATAEASP